MEAVTDTLPFRVVLAEDAAFFSERLKQAENNIFHVNSDWINQFKQDFSAAEFQYFRKHHHLTDNTSAKEALDLIKQISSALKQLPDIDIKLAFYPTRAFADKIVDWLDSFGPGPGKVNISVSPQIIGGLVLGYQGRIYDYSLESHLNYG